MKVVANHVIVTDSGAVGRFEELEDGRIVYLHHKLKPTVIDREFFEKCASKNTLPPVRSLT